MLLFRAILLSFEISSSPCMHCPCYYNIFSRVLSLESQQIHAAIRLFVCFDLACENTSALIQGQYSIYTHIARSVLCCSTANFSTYYVRYVLSVMSPIVFDVTYCELRQSTTRREDDLSLPYFDFSVLCIADIWNETLLVDMRENFCPGIAVQCHP